MSNELYEKYKEKYNLPDYKKLSKEFQVKLEEDDENVLEEVLDSMIDKVNGTIESFEGVMTGEGFSSVFEASMLSLEDKDRVFTIYRNMKSLIWEARIYLSKGEEKESAETIKRMFKAWNESIPEIEEICKKLSHGWKTLDFKNMVDTLYHR